MAYQTDLLPALKDWGLNVVEVNGWRTRGSSVFNPRGSVNHHTAGSRNNSLPSLNILVNGRAGLPGPLCNVAQSRSTQYNPHQEFDTVYLVAAGRANHAGYGGWKGLSGNSSVFGLEIEHVGYLDREPWPERRQHTAFRIHCAFMEAGGFGVDRVCQHKEWAPTRKIDFVGANGANFRHAVALTALSKNAPPPEPEKEWDDDMIAEMIKTYYKLARGNDYDVQVRDPKGYLHWLSVCARSDNPVDVVNDHLRPGLQGEVGREFPKV